MLECHLGDQVTVNNHLLEYSQPHELHINIVTPKLRENVHLYSVVMRTSTPHNFLVLRERYLLTDHIRHLGSIYELAPSLYKCPT